MTLPKKESEHREESVTRDADAAAAEARRVAVDVANGKVHCDRIVAALRWAAEAIAALRSTPTTGDAEELAAEIASDLFRDGQGLGAKRLVMEREGQRIDGCGWSQAGVRGRIVTILRARSGDAAESREATGAWDAE